MKRVLNINILLISVFMCCMIGYATDNPNSDGYYDFEFRTSRLGQYKIELTATETPFYETLPLDKVPGLYDKFPTSTWTGYTEVDNTEPSARYGTPIPKIKVDVAFATGAMGDQMDAFQNSIAELEAKLRDSRNNLDVKIQYIETVTGGISSEDADVDSILNSWRQVGAQVWSSSSGQLTCRLPGGSTVGSGSWQGTLIIDPEEEAQGIQDIVIECRSNNSAELMEGVCWHVTENSDGTFNGYFLNFGSHGYRYNPSASYSKGIGDGVSLMKFSNVDFTQPFDGSHMGNLIWCGYTGPCHKGHTEINAGASITHLDGYGRLLDNGKIRVEMTGSNIKVYYNNAKIMEANDSTYTEGTYGFWGNNCEVTRSMLINEISVAYDKTTRKTLVQATTDVNWRDDAHRFIIHSTDEVPQELQPGHDSEFTELISYLNSGNIFLFNLGIDAVNKDEFNRLDEVLIDAQGNPRSKYLRNYPIKERMLQAAQEIIDMLKQFQTESEWILVDSDINWTVVEWADFEQDVPLNFGEHDGTGRYGDIDKQVSLDWGVSLTHLWTQPKILAERWRFRHFEDYFDNNLGKVNYNGAWIEDAPTSFSKTGKYRINYQRKDNPFHTDVSLSSVFDMYRKWSTNYNDN